MERREFIKCMLVLAGGAMVPLSSVLGKGGTILWGEKVLRTPPDALRMMNVRRSLLYIQKQIEGTMNGFIMEPDSRATREYMRGAIINLCSQLKQGGSPIRDYNVDYDIDPASNNVLVLNLYIESPDVHMRFWRTAERREFNEGLNN